MSDRFARRIAIVLSALTVCACAASGPSRLPAARVAAIRHNERGVAAQQRGDLPRAAAEFREALRLQSSIENYPGMVTALINLARLGRQSGDTAAAGAATERALTLAKAAPELAWEVYFEQAKVLLGQARTAEAVIWTERALAAAPQENKSRLLNLLAEIRFSEGTLPAVRALAEEGLKLARETGNSREQANALRLLGEAALAEGRPAEAAERFGQALVSDKELGLSGKIRADLRGLARALEAVGDLAGAIGYQQRAVDVSVAGDDPKQKMVDQERLAELLAKSGDKARAEKVREELKLQ